MCAGWPMAVSGAQIHTLARFRRRLFLEGGLKYLAELISGVPNPYERFGWFRVVSVDFLRCTFFLLLRY